MSRYQQILDKEKHWKKRLYRWMPAYRFSNDIYEDSIKENLSEGTVWVDLGCGRNALVEELKDYKAIGIGLDRLEHPKLNRDVSPFLLSDIEMLPFRDNSVNLLTSNTVIEHIADPLSALTEMCRCLKPGGILIFRTPNKLHILNLILKIVPEGLKARLIEKIFGVPSEDVFPTFYRANRLRDIKLLCIKAGFSGYEIKAIEDVHTAFGFFFYLSLIYYNFARLKPMAFLRTNFIVTARK